MSGRVIDEHDVTVLLGDVREQLATLQDGSVNCVVTSPPYFGLRDYGCDGQIGLEATPAEYVAEMVAVFREVRRVLADDGVLWLNIGDAYARGNTGQGNKGPSSRLQGGTRPSFRSDAAAVVPTRRTGGLDQKNLLGMPWRVAFGLQDDGWIVRNDIVWHKSNAMPESVTDRLSSRYEHVFMFSKLRRYWFDLDPVREPVVYPAGSSALNWARDSKEADVPGQSMRQHRATRTHGKASAANLAPTGERHLSQSERGRNPGDVWTIPTAPFPGAHFACMPPELARRCILAGCPADGVVLDPFAGSGTTLKVARSLGRRCVGIELNPEYIDIIRDRIGQPTFDFSDGAA